MNAPQSAVHFRLAALRQAMQAKGLSAVIIPSADPHLSEYLPERWQGRRWLSGFLGSVGTLIVCADFAGLWVDGRYWVQAETELAGSGISLMKIGVASSPAHIDWLANKLPAGSVVAIDGEVLGLAMGRSLKGALNERHIVLRTDLDLLNLIWDQRPDLPGVAVHEHPQPFATVSRATKLAQLRGEISRLGAEWHFISTLDDIAWLFNLRGSDVSYNPVFAAHALIGPEKATLYLAAGKVSEELATKLAADGVAIADYKQAGPAVQALPAQAKLLIDPRRVTQGLLGNRANGAHCIEAINPTTLSKSIKSEAEMTHVRRTMSQDGAALCEFFSWLEQSLLDGARVTEVDIDTQITGARARRPGFVSPSFATIAGFNGNGAMPHYSANPVSQSTIVGDGLLLIDSGGQYLGGTTDITRTIAIGTPTDAQRHDFTLVLKGMIQLSLARFPLGTRSPQLDALARAPIWAASIDYNHGTGHGVGYFLNVHEGPQSISPYTAPEPHTAMLAGMITSNEPGIYRPGQWGVRTENLMLSVAAGQAGFGDFLAFETLTLCPIDRRCISTELLRKDERAWLDGYHAEVRTRLLPLVDGAARDWLMRNTDPL
ncbi:aminopeptidase P family protein [Chitinimonas arctica]|uniref:Aminopeptidase P family protein n=1 Tax=Chitinimonas arctica TaxID=2594795 RepID=A0A516SEE9_9NEIS|nr:aminopeptidase P family protein [Chitinimonas arctica]QDQ26532.1 aminopeptidase P family protein [Chitinimonas arctica]